ncbi:hypothetical protein [Bacillus carboniphilus]|uniref:hypothetical protein n=1 Tax=Bacillus carboniphilus TaxID=86663 RepID=UPI0031DDE39D
MIETVTICLLLVSITFFHWKDLKKEKKKSKLIFFFLIFLSFVSSIFFSTHLSLVWIVDGLNNTIGEFTKWVLNT